MFSRKIWLTVYTASCLYVATALTQSADAQSDSTSTNLIRTIQRISEYNKSRNLSDLDEAISNIESAADIYSLTPLNFIEQRRRIVHGYALVFNAIESSYDRNYNPAQKLTCPVPPAATGLAGLPCTDPQRVKDPKQRAAYAAQLSAYRNAADQAIRYARLLRRDQLTMADLKSDLDRFRKVAPTKTPPDYVALDSILRSASISETRRGVIDTWFYARDGE